MKKIKDKKENESKVDKVRVEPKAIGITTILRDPHRLNDKVIEVSGY